MDKNHQCSIVVGIDVGGKKGFHGVALRNGSYIEKFKALKPEDIAVWCRKIGASIIGIDAPCRWSHSNNGKVKARTAERELAQDRIFCFATPSKEKARLNTNFYGWMLNGARLFEIVELHYPLFDGRHASSGPVCFETFPHAVACALAGKIVSAKQKSTIRTELLQRAGIKTDQLTNIDYIDAALCALTAHLFQIGRFNSYGKAEDGFIIVPN